MSTLHLGLGIEGQMLFTRSGNCSVIGFSYKQIFSNQNKPNNESLLNSMIWLDFKLRYFNSIKS